MPSRSVLTPLWPVLAMITRSDSGCGNHQPRRVTPSSVAKLTASYSTWTSHGEKV